MKSSNAKHYTPKDHIEAAASQLLEEGKKRANDLYSEGLKKTSEIEDTVLAYSDNLLKKVEKNPLSSVLIAAGIGFLLSHLMKK